MLFHENVKLMIMSFKYNTLPFNKIILSYENDDVETVSCYGCTEVLRECLFI